MKRLCALLDHREQVGWCKRRRGMLSLPQRECLPELRLPRTEVRDIEPLLDICRSGRHVDDLHALRLEQVGSGEAVVGAVVVEDEDVVHPIFSS